MKAWVYAEVNLTKVGDLKLLTGIERLPSYFTTLPIVVHNDNRVVNKDCSMPSSFAIDQSIYQSLAPIS